jgi:tetratricopeptide (TPR) repeat protein
MNPIKSDLEQLSVSRISRDTTNSTTPSHSKTEAQSTHSMSSNPETKTIEFKIFDSPARQQVEKKDTSDLNESFSQSFLVTSDDDVARVPSLSKQSNESSKWFDEAELAKFPNKYPSQIHELASTCLENGELDRSLSWFNILLDHYKAEYGELHPNIGATLHNIGIVQMRLEQYDEALLSFQRAVRVRRGAIGRDHADVATSLVKVGVVELFLRRFDSALLTFREALSVRRHALGHLHPSTARIYNNIGCAHAKFNEVREARCAFESALDVQRNALLYEPENKQLQFAASTTLSNLAHLYTSRGMYEKASIVLAEALSFQEIVFSNDHPLVMSTLDSLGDTYANFGENNKALKCYSDILERTEKKGNKNGKPSNKKRRAMAMLLYKTSRVYRKQNDFEAALRFLQDSFQHASQLASPELSSRIMNEIKETKQQLREANYDWV